MVTCGELPKREEFCTKTDLLATSATIGREIAFCTNQKYEIPFS